MIDDRPLRFRGEVYHPYHFNCSSCGIELNADAREVKSRPGYTANEMVILKNFHDSCFSALTLSILCLNYRTSCTV